MNVMRAAAIDRHGSPDVLTVQNLPRPVPGPGEILVRVQVAGVQPTDAAIRQGWTPPGATIVFPQVLGNEFAGRVAETGPGVTEFVPGDPVVGFRVLGCYAEYATVPVHHAVAKPPEVSWTVAGALSASGQTAHTALERLRPARGETLLVHGAAGGVGSVAVQLAVGRGARVIGTASPENQDHVRSLGAIPVVYGDGQVERILAAAPRGIDTALHTSGDDNLRFTMRLVSDPGRVGTIVDPAAAAELGCRWITSDRSAPRLRVLLDLCARGRLRVTVRRTLPLERAADAHRDVGTGHGRGKVALVIGDEAVEP